MANQRLSELTGVTPTTSDYVYLLDVSDTGDGAGGSSKKALVSGLTSLVTISDSTALGSLTGITDPAFLLVGDSGGTLARKLTPTGWGLSGLLETVSAGRIPYSDTDGTVTSSAGLTYDAATNGLTASPRVVANGSVYNGLALQAAYNGTELFGVYDLGGGSGRVYLNAGAGVNRLYLGENRVALDPAGVVAWASASGQAWNTVDTAFARNTTGVLEINNGTAGQYRDLTLRGLTATAGKLRVSGNGGTNDNTGIQIFNDGTTDWLVGASTNVNVGSSYYPVVCTSGGGVVAVATWNATSDFYLHSNGLALRSTGQVRWTAGGSFDTVDTAFARNSAGILEINNGTAGQYRDLIVRNATAEGTLTVRQPGGVAGTDQVEISHDGTRTLFQDKDTAVAGKYRFVIDTTAANDTLQVGNADGSSVSFYTGKLNGLHYTYCNAFLVVTSEARLVGAPYTTYGRLELGANGLFGVTLEGTSWTNPGPLKVYNTTSGYGMPVCGDPLPVTVTANQNNWAPGVAAIVDVTTDSTDRTVTGLVAGVHGERRYIRHVAGSGNLLLTHDDTGNSTAANCFDNETAATITVPLRGQVLLVYSTTTSRWSAYPSKTCT